MERLGMWRAGSARAARISWVGVACIGLSAPWAHAQVRSWSYGMEFVEIGAPGNRGANDAEAPLLSGGRLAGVGAVEHRYRISILEVTNTQYAEFVNTYAPYWDGHPNGGALTGFGVYGTPQSDGSWLYQPYAGEEQYAAQVSRRMASRFVNWLHNGKQTDRASFENGAYDTSTFGGDGSVYSDQSEHNPGAKYWIPSYDEWAKATYYDPHRYGAGQEGYWLYPNGTNEPLPEGPPGSGAQTWGEHGPLYGPDVGSFPNAPTPWGLLDTSGTVHEWTSTVFNDRGTFAVTGSTTGYRGQSFNDRIDFFGGYDPADFSTSLRIAAAIPTLPSWSICGSVAMYARRRRR